MYSIDAKHRVLRGVRRPGRSAKPTGQLVLSLIVTLCLAGLGLRAHTIGARTVFAAETANRGDGPASATPILLELFTSEGCSSCPPADNYIRQADRAQPIPGVNLIVLSEHVDYWDHDGWKDPFSSAALTERQDGYVRALGLSTPYTPQIIVNGTEILKGDTRQIKELYAKAAADPKVDVRVGSVTVEGQPPNVVRAHLDVEGAPAKHNADVFVAVTLDHAESQVLAGENSGKRLAYVAVVQEIKKVGKLEKGKNFSQDVQLKLKSAVDPKNLRIVAFVQEPGPGKVIGAAEQKPAS